MISRNFMTKVRAIIEAVASFTQGVATYLQLRNIIPQVEKGGLLLPDDNLHFGNSTNFMLIESEKLIYQGGMQFTSSGHPFLRFYSQGRDSLALFYEDFQPRCPLERHYLKCVNSGHSHRKGITQLLDIPWAQIPQNFSGEMGLSAHHGHQGFGPVSERKLSLEIQRLRSVLVSIEKFGFQPAGTNRLPRGYFLEDDESLPKRRIFLVGNGQHRVSALIYLGWKKIPVAFLQGSPRIIRISQIKQWPGVVSGRFKENQARAIFGSYFRTDQEGNF